MKIKKYIMTICCLSMFILLIGINLGAENLDIPEKIKIETGNKEINKVEYNDFYLSAKKIKIVNRSEIVYCLEVQKDYPSGETFFLKGEPGKEVDNIIAAGYPSKSPAELNLSSEDEAYFATQIAVWSSIEGYNVNKFKGSNPKILEAIKNIYNNGVKAKSSIKTVNRSYKIENNKIQQVVVVFEKDESSNINPGEKPEESLKPENKPELKPNEKPDHKEETEEEAESKQDEYPPQEG